MWSVHVVLLRGIMCLFDIILIACFRDIVRSIRDAASLQHEAAHRDLRQRSRTAMLAAFRQETHED